MKLRYIAPLLFLLVVPFLYGQTTTLPGMTEITAIAPNDLLWVWLDPTGANATRKIKASNLLKRNKSCEVVFGNADPASTALTDATDQPRSCRNISGADAIITAVACNADAGSPTVTPVLTGGGAIAGQFTCGNGTTWVAGVVSGSPTLHSFSSDGATCSTPPCTLDANLTAANGAKYVIIGFTILGQ